MHTELINQLSEIGIVPVVVIEDEAHAQELGKALMESGLRCAEVTFRTKAAAGAIKILTDNYPELIVGAGTVLTKEQADSAINAGSKFIVSPGLNPNVVTYCQEKGVPVVPGVMTPSEIEQAMSLGLTTVKFFPAEAAGGVKMLKALSAPYAGIKFMPTGGIDEKNVTDYLSLKNVFCCGGSWMVKKEMIATGEFDKIKEMAQEAVEIVKSVRNGGK
jgi:2-dehydro-3-deoxyphosphogluconate aldolase/(4S)-4-hydroxy-2-oxoglutarate aldolase